MITKGTLNLILYFCMVLPQADEVSPSPDLDPGPDHIDAKTRMQVLGRYLRTTVCRHAAPASKVRLTVHQARRANCSRALPHDTGAKAEQTPSRSLRASLETGIGSGNRVGVQRYAAQMEDGRWKMADGRWQMQASALMQPARSRLLVGDSTLVVSSKSSAQSPLYFSFASQVRQKPTAFSTFNLTPANLPKPVQASAY
jgi:hypothetical protein